MNNIYKYEKGKRVRVLNDKECIVCKKVFTPPTSKRIYCGRSCYYEMKRIRKDRVVWTDEMRKNMSNKFKGEKNPAFGKKQSKETIEKRVSKFRGENHFAWKGGFSINKNGYKVFENKGVKNGNRIEEHRLVMENYLGRKLLSSEIVHHINHNKLDNRVENLVLVTRAEHIKIHDISPKKFIDE